MRLALALSALCFAATVAAAPARVQVLVSADGEPYASAARELVAALGERGVDVTQATVDERWRGAGDADLVVALGTRAATAALHGLPRRPVLAALLPRAAWEEARANASENPGDGVVWLDQPAERVLRLAHLIAPRARAAGALHGPSTLDDRARYESAARTLGIGFRGRALAADDDVALALGALLTDTDVVIALPDARIWNRITVEPLLLATFRAGRPVVSSVRALVQAGAVAAVHSTPQQTAQELVELVVNGDHRVQRGPLRFGVEVNREVARALGLPSPDAATLAARLRAAEAGR